MYKMTTGKFLSKYYNIQGSELNNLTHDQISELFGIETSSDNDIDIDDVTQGKIILVEDVEKSIMGYNNPLFEKNNEECEELFIHPIIAEFYENLERETGLKRDDIQDLKLYELEELLKKSKRKSDNFTKKIVIKELHKRKELENNTKEEKLAKVRQREYREEMM